LQEFSHIWIIFIFDQYIGNYTKFKSKNDCPKVDEKKGIFATRSPCRFNPVGLSAARIEKVDLKNGIIYVSGIDLVNGTKIIDIKPYVKTDIIENAQIAPWVKDSLPSAKVIFHEKCVAEIPALLSKIKLEFYTKPEEIIELIQEVLGQSPHSKAAVLNKKCGIYAICLDKLEIIYSVNENFDEYKILKILEITNPDQIENVRTEKWLIKTKELLTAEKLI